MARCQDSGVVLAPEWKINSFAEFRGKNADNMLSGRFLQELVGCTKEQLGIGGVSAQFSVDEPGESGCSGVGSRIIPEVCEVMPTGLQVGTAAQKGGVLIQPGQEIL